MGTNTKNRYFAALGLALAASVAAATTASATGSPSAAANGSLISTTPIQHVVVIYQENHSFDNVLGAVCETRATPCDGFTGTVKLSDGSRVPMTQSPDIVPKVNHNIDAQVAAMDGGKMDGWENMPKSKIYPQGCDAASNYPCLTYYTPDQIPNLDSLADQYAVSDRTFSMADSPSWAGHLYPAAASLDNFDGSNPSVSSLPPGPGYGCDSDRIARWTNPSTGASSLQPSCIPDYGLDSQQFPYGGAFRSTPVAHVPTIFDRLDAVGGTWKIYGQPTPSKVNGNYPAGSLTGYDWSICPSFAGCFYTGQVNDLVPTANVLTDAANGTLPDYSILTPSDSSTQANGNHFTSQHNAESMIAGDNWIGKVVDAIENGPEALTTAIFITYDDCGCFYDHVAPGVNPDGTQQGPRVPMVIVSPWVKAGYTDSTPATFASILAFTEHTFGLQPLSVNDANAYDYSNAFNYAQTPLAFSRLSMHPIPKASLRYMRRHPNPVPDDDPT